MDNQAFELMNKKMERIEDKLDSLLEHKWQWTGKVSVIVTLTTIISSIIVSVATVVITNGLSK